jgi:predicted NBD/HSP70 family sugar kinase
MKRLTGKPQMLKEVNSSMIEQFIYEQGPLSKPTLAKLTSLSLPTVNKLVDTLEKNKRLSRVGRSGKGAGRKAILYETNRNSGCIIALHYAAGKYRCRITDMHNDTIHEAEYPIDSSSKESVESSTTGAIDSLVKRSPNKVMAIGIGLPGVVKPNGCLLGIPKIPFWEDFNLQKMLARRYKTAICVENTERLSVMGFYSRLKERSGNIAYIYVGTGVGAGLIINGQLYRGALHFSGEIGFMTSLVVDAGKSYAGRGGYMENHIGNFIDYSSGTLKAGKSREGLVNSLSMIAVNHIAILNPDLIVFCGTVISDALLGDIKKQVSLYIPGEVMPPFMRDTNKNSIIDGLTSLCLSSVTTEMTLVRRSGGIQRMAM